MPETATPPEILPLAGLRIVSMAELYPGPYATALMADLGAEVILVERPGGGDPARQLPSLFSALNRGKKSVAIDLKAPEGPATIRALLRGADIFLEGFRPGVLARAGLGYADIAAEAPRLIYVSISGFGQDGPYRDRPAHDVCFQALAGLLHDRIGRDGEQSAPVAPIADLTGGIFAVVAALAALHRRQATGRGGYVDVAMADSLVSLMTGMLAPALNGWPVPDPGISPAYGLFRCADDTFLSLSVIHEDDMWRGLCDVLGIADMSGLRYGQRVAEAAKLRKAIAAQIATRPSADWLPIFAKAGLPHAPVQDIAEVAADPHFVARGMFVPVATAGAVPEWHVRQPLRFDGVAPGPTSPAPKLGQHTAEILQAVTPAKARR